MGELEKMEEGVVIPKVSYEGSDQVLKEQVVHYEKGTRRIVIFTIVGLLMGWFSYRYYGETFLPLRIILAVPYKCSEYLHQALHPEIFRIAEGYAFGMDEFFPQAPYVSFLAEYGTAALFGGAIYGSLAYFTGDKRIFTLSGYVRFGCVWAAIIGIWTAALFGANEWQVSQNNQLKNVSGFFIEGDFSGSGYYPDTRKTMCRTLTEAFYEGTGPEKLTDGVRDPEGEREMDIFTGRFLQGAMRVLIHPEKGYLVTDLGYLYQMTDAFMEIYQECLEEENHGAETVEN